VRDGGVVCGVAEAKAKRLWRTMTDLVLFDAGLARLGPAVRGIVAELQAAADWSDDVEVEFGVKLSADWNLIIARTGGEANFRIAMRWTGRQNA
jgi:hypothetical protein